MAPLQTRTTWKEDLHWNQKLLHPHSNIQTRQGEVGYGSPRPPEPLGMRSSLGILCVRRLLLFCCSTTNIFLNTMRGSSSWESSGLVSFHHKHRDADRKAEKALLEVEKMDGHPTGGSATRISQIWAPVL